ncbi:MAG TPA: hypothetical protein VMA83_11765 [Solirubrobacteraceae bacterium]|nr:hypothetical protein [Solirubrobacteraceae bacterium]
MPKRSLRPHLNQIRTWVRQGRTDAWIAHQLEVSVRDIEQFKSQNELEEDAGGETNGYPDEIDLRAEDDALIAAELEAAEAEAERERLAAADREQEEEDDGEDDDEEGAMRRTRRRGRRGGRGRRVRGATLEGTFDHGDEGFGLWLDPAITENPVYAEHWAGHRPVEITIEEDRMVIRRAGDDD